MQTSLYLSSCTGHMVRGQNVSPKEAIAMHGSQSCSLLWSRQVFCFTEAVQKLCNLNLETLPRESTSMAWCLWCQLLTKPDRMRDQHDKSKKAIDSRGRWKHLIPLLFLLCFGFAFHQALYSFFNLSDVSKRKLKIDGVDIHKSINRTIHMVHIFILKTSHHLHIDSKILWALVFFHDLTNFASCFALPGQYLEPYTTL